MLKVYIESGSRAYRNMFRSSGWEIVARPSDATLVVFTGGADVSPQLYGEFNVASNVYIGRDLECVALYNHCRANNIPMAGICRGGQFLNVMNNGRLYQDVNGHCNGNHEATILSPDLITKSKITVSSTHHQMMRIAEHGILYAYARESSLRVTDKEHFTGRHVDAEVILYPRTKSLCFQPHPEFEGVPDCRSYFFKLVNRLLELD